MSRLRRLFMGLERNCLAVGLAPHCRMDHSRNIFYRAKKDDLDRASRRHFMGRELYGLLVILARHCPLTQRLGIFYRAKNLVR